jgi:hypothetical protein
MLPVIRPELGVNWTDMSSEGLREVYSLQPPEWVLILFLASGRNSVYIVNTEKWRKPIFIGF